MSDPEEESDPRKMAPDVLGRFGDTGGPDGWLRLDVDEDGAPRLAPALVELHGALSKVRDLHASSGDGADAYDDAHGDGSSSPSDAGESSSTQARAFGPGRGLSVRDASGHEHDEKGLFTASSGAAAKGGSAKGTGRSKAAADARQGSRDAHEATKAAVAGGNHETAAKAHEAARDKHLAAAKASRKEEYRKAHEAAAKAHSKVADAHRAEAEKANELSKAAQKREYKNRLTRRAESLSKGADEQSETANKDGGLDAHERAALAHRSAQSAHELAAKETKSPRQRDQHLQKAEEHKQKAASHDAEASRLAEKNRAEARKAIAAGSSKITDADRAAFAKRLSGGLGDENGKGLDQAEVRNSLREHLARYGLRSKDEGQYGEHKYKIDQAETERIGCNAYHVTDGGHVVVSADVHKRAVERVAALAKDPHSERKAYEDLSAKGSKLADVAISERASGVRTLLHEETHGHSPLGAAGYVGVGVGIEEAGTEIIARKATREFIGVHSALQLPHASVGSDGKVRYAGGHGSYGNYIRGLMTAVHEHTGGGPDVGTRIEDAFIRMRSGSVPGRYRMPNDQAQHFVDTIKGPGGASITHGQRASLLSALTDPKGPMSEGWAADHPLARAKKKAQAASSDSSSS